MGEQHQIQTGLLQEDREMISGRDRIIDCAEEWEANKEGHRVSTAPVVGYLLVDWVSCDQFGFSGSSAGGDGQ